jgi:hypothetical protein
MGHSYLYYTNKTIFSVVETGLEHLLSLMIHFACMAFGYDRTKHKLFKFKCVGVGLNWLKLLHRFIHAQYVEDDALYHQRHVIRTCQNHDTINRHSTWAWHT